MQTLESIKKSVQKIDYWYLVIIIGVIVLSITLIILLDNKYEFYSSDYPLYCPNCGDLDKQKCDGCINCGYCITPNGQGECVEGDEQGPLFRQDCIAYQYTFNSNDINQHTGQDTQLQDQSQIQSQVQSVQSAQLIPNTDIQNDQNTQYTDTQQLQQLSQMGSNLPGRQMQDSNDQSIQNNQISGQTNQSHPIQVPINQETGGMGIAIGNQGFPPNIIGTIAPNVPTNLSTNPQSVNAIIIPGDTILNSGQNQGQVAKTLQMPETTDILQRNSTQKYGSYRDGVYKDGMLLRNTSNNLPINPMQTSAIQELKTTSYRTQSPRMIQRPSQRQMQRTGIIVHPKQASSMSPISKSVLRTSTPSSRAAPAPRTVSPRAVSRTAAPRTATPRAATPRAVSRAAPKQISKSSK